MFIKIREGLIFNVKHIVCLHREPDPAKKDGTSCWYVELLDHHAERITKKEYDELHTLMQHLNRSYRVSESRLGPAYEES